MKTRLGGGGRIVIPAEYRRAMGINEGDLLFMNLVDGELQIRTPLVAIRKAQELLRPSYEEDGRSWADELIAERRAEAARELAEEAFLQERGSELKAKPIHD